MKEYEKAHPGHDIIEEFRQKFVANDWHLTQTLTLTNLTHSQAIEHPRRQPTPCYISSIYNNGN